MSRKQQIDGWFAVEIAMLIAFFAVLIYPLFGKVGLPPGQGAHREES